MYLWYRYNIRLTLPQWTSFFIFRLWLGYSAPRPNLTKGSLLLPSWFNFSSTALPCMNSVTPGMYRSYNTISLHHFDMGLHASCSSEMEYRCFNPYPFFLRWSIGASIHIHVFTAFRVDGHSTQMALRVLHHAGWGTNGLPRGQHFDIISSPKS